MSFIERGSAGLSGWVIRITYSMKLDKLGITEKIDTRLWEVTLLGQDLTICIKA